MPKVKADGFSDAVGALLQEYAEDATKTVKETTEKVAKEGLKSLKSAAAGAYGKGRYASSWKIQSEGDRVSRTAVIYSTVPGLPHLLEYGHANRNGGRTPGRSHIKPVETDIIQNYQRQLEGAL